MTSPAAKAKRFGAKFEALYLRCISKEASPRMAIKCFCIECQGYRLNDAKSCKTVECPLHAYMKRTEK